MIPALVCPVLNRADLFMGMVRSIDYPVNRFIVINNGDDPAVSDALEQLEMEDEFVLTIDKPKYNMGVASSWNWAMKAAPQEDYWLFIGNDIKLAKGDLAKIDKFIREHPDYATVPANWGHSLFAVTQVGLNAVGYFDENFYPAYCEDQDWMYRLKLTGLPWADCPDVHALHGEPPLWGSSTIWSDLELLERCKITQANNKAFYKSKWGGLPGEEIFKTPFNDPALTIKDCVIDEELAEANENPVWSKK